ncbi:pyridoxamine 5'-phosphate oxidase family protein [Blastococcus litoris]|uniref:pyridoxamine 5'-phosphate oxidase family protein n=1 Tax=Blastococcus litoris TaxID=2171622 RepID=UPI000E3044F0|nr:pyridoxamine 5'-phosphate oxidase family protein [Blastococcus litoris]
MEEITTEAQLRALLGEPARAALDKERDSLHELDRQWLAHSPLCLVATSDADGRCDVSPKGDPPGWVLVLDDRTIALPERAGNRRADGFRNVLANPHVGLVFLLPGRTDTLRINGRARLVTEAGLLDRMVVKGHRPLLALVVDIEQVFHHCGKAFLRSQLWEPGTWDTEAVPSRARIAQRLERPDEPLAQLEAYYGPGYAAGLYPPTAGPQPRSSTPPGTGASGS